MNAPEVAMDTENAPPPPFFAESDEEHDSMLVDDEQSSPSSPCVASSPSPKCPSSRSSPPSVTDPLFLEDSDNDGREELPLVSSKKRQAEEVVDVDILEAPPESVHEAHASTSASTFLTRRATSSPTPKVTNKRPRLLSDASRVVAPPLSFCPAYLGELVVPNAWSNVSGKNYVKLNDKVLVRREQEDSVKTGSSRSKAPNGTGSKSKVTTNLKQVSLTSMLKANPLRPAKKKKADTIVRLVNNQDMEFGRLPVDTSWWISKLLELDIVEVRGVMTDCPERLTTGVGLIVTLHFYLLEGAFLPLSVNNDGENVASFGFNEGLETEEESSMRERKSAIVKLFEVVGLKPQAGVNFPRRKSETKIREEALKRMAKKSSKKKEVVGDGEEIEVDGGEELSRNEIDAIYNKAQRNDRVMSSMEPAKSFSLTLRGYQKQALFWMYSLEMGNLDAREAHSMHPLWSEQVSSDYYGDVIDLTAEEKLFYFNPYSGELSLKFPKAERRSRGGILAQPITHNFSCFQHDISEMGMGKTIMLSALIQTSLPIEDSTDQDHQNAPSRVKQLKLNKAFQPLTTRVASPKKPPSATLIVAPASLLQQWADELRRSSIANTLDIFLWHGQSRLDLESLIESDEDDATVKVVITSYGTLASEYAKMDRSNGTKPPVFDITWWRVILDEAHSCKSRTSKTARAVYALSAKRRWAVTGTPIVNKLEDLYSLLKFLDFKPWSEFSFFRSFITIPFLAGDPKAIEVVQIILESILLRREKSMTDVDGKKIVDLPPKEVVIEELEFTPLERKIYDSIYRTAKVDFDALDAKGLVGKNYTHILAMLMKLRRAVLHPKLVMTKDDERALSPEGHDNVDVDELLKRLAEGGQSSTDSFTADFMASLKGDNLAECPICFGEMEAPMIVPDCMHQFCKECIICHIGICEERKQQANCPTCNHGPLQKFQLVEVMQEDPTATPSGSESVSTVTFRRNNFQSSTKLDALVKNLRSLKGDNPAFRAIVFSQFTSFLDLIQVALERERFDHYRFDGTMDIKKKGAAIANFNAPSSKPKVLVISLKAGGVGLNLTTANYVFMMDCWWNAAVENQAIDRVHRIGQEKTVYVKHFIVARTIEKRILQIQKRKTAIVNEAFRGSKESKTDPQSIQNLKIMFGDD